MNRLRFVSACCGSVYALAPHDVDEPLDEGTRYFICKSCGEPCDIEYKSMSRPRKHKMVTSPKVKK